MRTRTKARTRTTNASTNTTITTTIHKDKPTARAFTPTLNPFSTRTKTRTTYRKTATFKLANLIAVVPMGICGNNKDDNAKLMSGKMRSQRRTSRIRARTGTQMRILTRTSSEESPGVFLPQTRQPYAAFVPRITMQSALLYVTQASKHHGRRPI